MNDTHLDNTIPETVITMVITGQVFAPEQGRETVYDGKWKLHFNTMTTI
ncbi:hypothetical protein AALA22_09015 [Anaerovoracaceae bacterium 41-7]